MQLAASRDPLLRGGGALKMDNKTKAAAEEKQNWGTSRAAHLTTTPLCSASLRPSANCHRLNPACLVAKLRHSY